MKKKQRRRARVTIELHSRSAFLHFCPLKGEKNNLDIYLPWAARFLRYSSKDSPEAMAPFLPRELFSADTGVGSLV